MAIYCFANNDNILIVDSLYLYKAYCDRNPRYQRHAQVLPFAGLTECSADQYPDIGII